jgi:hypothetical protein
VKPHLRSLKKNQEVWAVVEEIIALNEVIINFSGDLVRVQNKTEKIFRVGQRVLLQVHSIYPLKLKLIMKTTRPARSSSVLDLSI